MWLINIYEVFKSPINACLLLLVSSFMFLMMYHEIQYQSRIMQTVTHRNTVLYQILDARRLIWRALKLLKELDWTVPLGSECTLVCHLCRCCLSLSLCLASGVGQINDPGFPGDSDGKESACYAGHLGLIPWLGRSPGEGNGTPLRHSCLENPMDRGALWATVQEVAKSWTRLSY